MSREKPKVPQRKQGIAALPEYLKANATAEAVLDHLQQNGVISTDQAKRLLESTTKLVQVSNSQSNKFWKSIDASVNAAGSNDTSKEAAKRMQDKLFDWLDQNAQKHKGNLDDLAHKAFDANVVGRSVSWIRKQITLWKERRRK